MSDPKDTDLTRASRFLARVLRHRPDRVGIELDAHGWVAVEVLIRACQQHGSPMDRALLEQVVTGSEKKRFEFDSTRQRVRATYGHSVEIVLDMAEAEPPETLYHGTGTQNIESIRESGLLKGARQHVHLSADEEVARAVGRRKGKSAVLAIDARAMTSDGFKFLRAANDVWLVDRVPTRFIQFPGQGQSDAAARSKGPSSGARKSEGISATTVYLSFNAVDQTVAENVVKGVRTLRPSVVMHLGSIGPSQSASLVGYDIDKADAFLFLFRNDVGPWQRQEFLRALDRKTANPQVPIVVVLLDGAALPKLRSIETLPRFETHTPAAPEVLREVLAALHGPTNRQDTKRQQFTDSTTASAQRWPVNYVRAVREVIERNLRTMGVRLSLGRERVKALALSALSIVAVLSCFGAAKVVADAWFGDQSARSLVVGALRNEMRDMAVSARVAGDDKFAVIGRSIVAVRATDTPDDVEITGHGVRVRDGATDGSSLVSVDSNGVVRVTRITTGSAYVASGPRLD